ncbi:MAG: alpha/beta hydrolase [Gammaproteobacteria bacterium]|nr:alpha/beta hydrolase [Gammaproteobacteria bacterium]
MLQPFRRLFHLLQRASTSHRYRRALRLAACQALLLVPAAVWGQVSATLTVPDPAGGTTEIDIDYRSPPGRLVDVGSHRLHIFCLGAAAPTIVIDAGLGSFSLEWLRVQKRLARDYRVCAYDRGGYGWSESGPLPRNTDALTEELHALLRRAGLKPPFVLVGHSFGGYVVQSYARRYPAETAAMVLVDSSHPAQARVLRESIDGFPTFRDPRTRFTSRPRLPANYPPQLETLAYQMMGQRRAARAQRNELREFVNSGSQVLRSGAPVDVPVIVVTRGEQQWAVSAEGDERESKWRTLQRGLAGDFRRSEHVFALYSGHYIHLDQPWLVEDSIQRAARAAASYESLPMPSSSISNMSVEFGPMTAPAPFTP